MANRQRGDVDVELAGKVYTIQLGVNALVWLESRFGPDNAELSLADVLKLMQSRKRMTDIRAVFCAGLQEHHPGTTEAEAGSLMQSIGLAKVGDVIQRAIVAALPDDRDVEELTPNPPKAQAVQNRGHGDRSISMPAVSA